MGLKPSGCSQINFETLKLYRTHDHLRECWFLRSKAKHITCRYKIQIFISRYKYLFQVGTYNNVTLVMYMYSYLPTL